MFINILTQVIILLILILIGFVLAKRSIITKTGAKCMTDIALYLATPCVIIKSFIREYDSSLLKGLILSFLIAFLTHVLFIVLSKFLFRNCQEAQKRVLQFGVIFSNCGFMALPLQQVLLGDLGVFYGSSYVAVFNLFTWSYGILLMSGDKKYLSPKKLIISPGIIGLTAGLLIFLLSIPLPKVVSEPIFYMASLNTPLPMIIIGFHLANSDFIKGLKNLNCLLAIIVRLFAFPLIALFIMYLCGIRGTLLVSSFICCSAPTAAINTMFSAKFDCDTSLSVNLVSVSTLLSLISMPLLILLAQYLA
ncbi:MAG: AEC family transporter [Clostridia bacterium]|nr:AEC family transporter [Clostridia bacterium]